MLHNSQEKKTAKELQKSSLLSLGANHSLPLYLWRSPTQLFEPELPQTKKLKRMDNLKTVASRNRLKYTGITLLSYPKLKSKNINSNIYIFIQAEI